MQRLREGIEKFRRDDFETHRDLFGGLKDGQNPHTLFITCSDSRIDPNMITNALPGELFVIRNVANIVPMFDDSVEYPEASSAIEYAVLELGVDNIIVCGHSHCGGCAAALDPSGHLEKLPRTKKWLEAIGPVKDRICLELPHATPESRKVAIEQGSVVEQLKRLRTYPFISDKIAAGKLKISGWYYVIETGEVFIYDDVSKGFKLGN
ncbi:MAG: carbonic anhydrase [Actinobacteria bacterium]|nr:carbonic anhydrase [Actinomycetota bacterium]